MDRNSYKLIELLYGKNNGYNLGLYCKVKQNIG